MKKTEMGRFNISPDEDSSSYSSNSDFNYSYPTKQAALKRWGESALQKQTKTKKPSLHTGLPWGWRDLLVGYRLTLTPRNQKAHPKPPSPLAHTAPDSSLLNYPVLLLHDRRYYSLERLARTLT